MSKYAIVLLICCFLAQIVSFRLFYSRLKNKLYRNMVIFLFVLFNIFWILTFYKLSEREPISGYFLSLIARPAISWQSVQLLVVLPLSIVIYLLYYVAVLAIKLISKGKKSTKASNSLQGTEDRAPDAPPQVERRDFLKKAGAIGLGGILAFSTYAVIRQSISPSVRRLNLKIPNLPRELHGFTIAHLTDLHLGLWASQHELDLALVEAAKVKPDLVIFTGDMVDRDPQVAGLYHGPVERRLSAVPYGVYTVLGNHDHFNNPDKIEEILNTSGMKVLREERVNIGNLPLSLTGLDDQSAYGRTFRRKQAGMEARTNILDFSEIKGPSLREGDFKILLNHRPEGFKQAMEEGYGLYLVGHTHGGQYAIPGFSQANLATLIYEYTSGLYEDFGGFLNVSSGLASVGIPFRFGPWPEFSLITLERA
ncbi:MAG: metallophosphoesterase [Deltaproteobacteria bacterium]|nr:metallophosphoesterase [Deltaproteobacteria bacterium]